MARRTERKHSSGKKKTISIICAITTALAVVIAAYFPVRRLIDQKRLEGQQDRLATMMATPVPTSEPFAEATTAPEPEETTIVEETPEPVEIEYEVLPEYQLLYYVNPDLIGWLRIDDTVIDYPVVQTPEDEEKYLYLDFDGNSNANGTLIMDNGSTVGVGTAEQDYLGGTEPSTNLIIHGHTMKSGAMFGYLPRYEDQSYGEEHNIICFDSLYEHREYELISVFYTQVYYPTDDVFKYYKFFQADTQEEFDDWYDNIKAMSLYDTGVTAEFGDEFITLSCCSYQVEDGRFVVVGKRIS